MQREKVINPYRSWSLFSYTAENDILASENMLNIVKLI